MGLSRRPRARFSALFSQTRGRIVSAHRGLLFGPGDRLLNHAPAFLRAPTTVPLDFFAVFFGRYVVKGDVIHG